MDGSRHRDYNCLKVSMALAAFSFLWEFMLQQFCYLSLFQVSRISNDGYQVCFVADIFKDPIFKLKPSTIVL